MKENTCIQIEMERMPPRFCKPICCPVESNVEEHKYRTNKKRSDVVSSGACQGMKTKGLLVFLLEIHFLVM